MSTAEGSEDVIGPEDVASTPIGDLEELLIGALLWAHPPPQRSTSQNI